MKSINYHFKNLEVLRLGNGDESNPLTTFPVFMTLLTQLKEFQVNLHQLQYLPNDARLKDFLRKTVPVGPASTQYEQEAIINELL